MAERDDLVDDLFARDALTRAVLSRPAGKGAPRRVTVEPVELKTGPAYRFTRHLPDRTTDENLPAAEARARVVELLGEYRQGLLQSPEADWQVLGDTVLRRPPTRPSTDRAHDRRKRRLLEEGVPVPFLVELGVMSTDGKVRKSRYDKFRQVNRFLELVDDVVPALPEGRLRVVDFGSGKSYLTFAVHHLLTELRGREVELVGIDRKADVVEACSALAARLGTDGLRFEQGDIAGFDAGGPVDLVVSLHACDTATDDALAQAVAWEAAVILAVPCCHQEAFRQLQAAEQLAPLFRHGLVKERVAALATDSLRAQLLELAGYRTQLVEFVDLEHTPKNILIRATRGRPAGPAARRAYEGLRDQLGLEPTLERLLEAQPRVKT